MSAEDDRSPPPRTVVMPAPGGMRPAQPQGGPTPPEAARPAQGGAPPAGAPPAGLGGGTPAHQPAFDASEARPGVNPLVDAASDLLDLVVYLQAQAMPLDVDGFRAKAFAQMKLFQSRASAAGIEPDVTEVARYALAATIDDAVLARPWGLDAGYADRTLVSALYEEKIGGERFFEYLDQAENDVNRYGDLIELMYVCLALGFQGVYRVAGRRPPQELEDRRARAFAAVRKRRDGFARDLSLQWRGVETRRKPIRDLVPTWLVAVVSVVVCAGLFFAFVWRAGDVALPAVAAASALPPLAEVEVASLELPPPEPPAPPPPPPQEQRVASFLQPEIDEGLVAVLNEGGEVRIRLVGAGMFRSGSADLMPRYEDVLERVAVSLRDEPGAMRIEGHSDSVPIRTARFPSNYHLSEARAEAVRAYLAPILQDPSRMSVEGFGANVLLDPSNPTGAVNRRVELVLAPDAG